MVLLFQALKLKLPHSCSEPNASMFGLLRQLQVLSPGFVSPIQIYDPVTGYDSMNDPAGCVVSLSETDNCHSFC